MNFWKVFRWVCAALFLAVVLLALLTSGGPIESNQLPPAPVFR